MTACVLQQENNKLRKTEMELRRRLEDEIRKRTAAELEKELQQIRTTPSHSNGQVIKEEPQSEAMPTTCVVQNEE